MVQDCCKITSDSSSPTMEMFGMDFFNYNDKKNEECKHFDVKPSFYFACMFVLCLAIN